MVRLLRIDKKIAFMLTLIFLSYMIPLDNLNIGMGIRGGVIIAIFAVVFLLFLLNQIKFNYFFILWIQVNIIDLAYVLNSDLSLAQTLEFKSFDFLILAISLSIWYNKKQYLEIKNLNKIIIIYFIANLIVIYDHLFGLESIYGNELGSLLFNTNEMGKNRGNFIYTSTTVYLSTFVVFLLLWIKSRFFLNTSKIFYLLFIIGLLATNSRAMQIISIFLLVGMTVDKFRIHISSKLLIFIVIAISATIPIVTTYPEYFDMGHRIYIWQDIIFGKNSISGGSFPGALDQVICRDFYNSCYHFESSIISSYLSTGWIGLINMTLPLGYLIYKFIKNSLFVPSILIIFVIINISIAPVYYGILQAVNLGVAYGYSIVILEYIKRNKNSKI